MKNSQGKNYYELLGVRRDASREEIKAAYREIALVYHPDSNFFDEIIGGKASDEGDERFRIITNAYTTLMNKEARARYDQTLPPVLRDWNEGLDTYSDRRAKTAQRDADDPLQRSAPAMGVFGKVQPAVEPEPPPEPPQGVIDRILALFKR